MFESTFQKNRCLGYTKQLNSPFYSNCLNRQLSISTAKGEEKNVQDKGYTKFEGYN